MQLLIKKIINVYDSHRFNSIVYIKDVESIQIDIVDENYGARISVFDRLNNTNEVICEARNYKQAHFIVNLFYYLLEEETDIKISFQYFGYSSSEIDNSFISFLKENLKISNVSKNDCLDRAIDKVMSDRNSRIYEN